MSEMIDARGLSCPQPVLMTIDEIKKAGKGKITILVDSETARENVNRAAVSQGWSVVELREQDDACKLLLSKD
jgi:tRNA 2-thiouridine synthesizing protein A